MDDFTPLATDDFEPLAPPPQDVFDLPQKAAITQWASDVGSKVAPERNADVIRLSAVTGLPPQSVHDNFDLVKEQIDRKKIDYASLAKTHPILSEFLSQPERAGVAQGDEGVLGTIEGLFRGWRDIPKGAGQQWDVGAITQEKGRIGARMMDGRATKADMDRLKAIEADEASNKPLKFGYLSGFIPQSAQAASQFFGPFRDPEATVRIWGTAGAGALAGAAAGAPAAGVGAGPGAAAGFFAGLGAGYQSEATYANAIAEAGNAYLEYMKIPGVTHEDAVAHARLVGLVNGGIEFIALDKVIGLVPGARALVSGSIRGTLREAIKDTTRRAAVGRLMKAIVAKGFVEGAQEAAQEFVTIFEGIRVRPDQPNSMEALKESFSEENRARMWESGKGGTQMSLIGLPSSMVQFTSDFRKAQQSEVNAALFTALGDAAKESKTRSRLPSVFRSFVDSVQEETGGPVESVKVPASNLNTLFQTEGITSAEVEREMPEVARQMREAVEAGTPELEVAVPIADMATKIAPLSGYAGLHEDMRIGDGLTIRESKKVMAEAEKIYTEQKDPARAATPAEKVAEDIGAKLEATGMHPKTARQQAVLWSAFAEARASRTGAKDAWDYYSKARVEVQRDEKAGAGENTLTQVLDHTATPEFKKWFGESKAVDEAGKPVVVYRGTGWDEGGGGKWWTDQPDTASGYASARAEMKPVTGAAQVTPAYLSLQNPLVVDAGGMVWDSIPFPFVDEFGDEHTGESSTEEIADWAKEHGHDGVIFKNVQDMMTDEGGVGNVYVAFDEKSVLSALSPEAVALADRIAAALEEANENGGPTADSEVALPPTTTLYQIERNEDGSLRNDTGFQEWTGKISEWMKAQGHSDKAIAAQVKAIEGQMKIFSALGPARLEMLPIGAGAAPGPARIKKGGTPNPGGPIRANVDPIYKISFDASAMCVKRLEASATQAYVQSKIKRTLTASERLALVALFKQAGKIAPCIYCYVESPRAKAGEFAAKAISVVTGERPVPAHWKKDAKASAKAAVEHFKSKGMKPGDIDPNIFTDPAVAQGESGKAFLVEHRPIFDFLMQQILYAKANAPKLYEEYKGQILDLPDSLIEELNDYAGFRFFSTSDFQAEHVIDLVQAFRDLSLRKAKAHGYTKVVDFVKIFGATGMKIQTSIFAKEVDGKFVEDTFQGMGWDDAKSLRKKFDNVGTCFVATSDAQVDWALDQKWIDYIIPFHYSGLEKKYYEQLGWQDFTAQQSEKSLVKGEKADKIRMHELGVEEGASNEEMSEAYRKLAKKRGLKPVFAKWADHPQFAKLKKDYARTDTAFVPVDATKINIKEVGRVLETVWNDTAPKAKEDKAIGNALVSMIESGAEDIGVTALQALESGQKVARAVKKSLNVLQQTKDDNVRGSVSFDNARTYFSVTLTGKANLSTFLHESGHAFVEMLRRDAAAGHAESQTDLAALEEFAGVTGGAWTVDAQEKLARAFEKYLAEGEAPSNKLEAAFRSFKDWMAMVYRTLVGLNVELDERTRQVFGRLLATDQEINERARVTGLTMPDFGEVKGGIFTAAEHARLKGMWDDGIAAMKESLLASSISALRRDVDAERARVEAEVSAELNADKTQNAWAWLMTGRRLDDAEVELEHDKIQAQAVKDAPITDQERRRLRKVTTEDFGTSADDVAPYFGFDSGSDLIVALARRESLQKARRRMVDERMAAMYPEGTQDHISKGATEEVQKALSGRLGRVLEAELDAVGAKVGGEPGRVILAAIRQAARRAVAGMTMAELDPAKYARAAAKAQKDYLEAIATGEGAIAAFQAKRNHAWALEMWRAASEAQAKVESIRKYLDTFSKDSKRSKIFKAGANYLAAIDALLEGIEFKRRTGTTLHKRAGLAAYLAEMEAAGETVNIPVEARTEALLKNYRQMSLDELLGVEAAVSNLETLARLKNKLTGIQANRKLSATSADLADSIHDSWAEKGEGKIHPGLADEMKRFLRKGRADLLKIEFLTRALDGGKTAGLAHTLIFQPFARAEAEKMRLVEQILGEFKKPFDDMPVAERMRLHRKVDFLGEQLSFSEVLAVALNWGNEGNREKLLEGYKGKGWTEQKVMDRLDELLEARDWQLVTHIWKTIDSLWPMITDLARRSVGAEVDKVEGVTIHTRHGPVAGGYYPAVYDRKQRGPRVGKGMALRDPEELAQMKSGQLFENNFMAPGGLVDRGFTKSRTKYAAPILLSLSVVPAHVTEVIHYLTHFEAVRDVDKLLRQDVVKTAVEDAVGVEGYKAFRPWLQAIANNGKAATAALYYETFLRKARLGTSIVMLGGKLTTGLIQGLGLLPAMKELKTKHILSGFKTFLTEGFSEAREQSPSFRYQEEHFDRDLGDVYDRMASTFGEVSHLRNQITTMSMAWIKLVQGSVNAITWYAAREQAEQAGHADPVAYADATVRLTQSSGGIKDLAAVQRGGETQKLFTVMYSYFSTLFGQLTEPVPDSKTAREKTAIYAARWWWAVMLPVVVEAFARGKRPDGDEPEDWATFILKEQLLYTGRTIPFIGDIADAALSGRQPRGNPWLTTMTKGVKALGGAAGEGEMTESQKRAVIDLIGAATRMPTGGAVNAYRYLDAFTNGEMEEPVQNLLFRSPGAFK